MESLMSQRGSINCIKEWQTKFKRWNGWEQDKDGESPLNSSCSMILSSTIFLANLSLIVFLLLFYLSKPLSSFHLFYFSPLLPCTIFFFCLLLSSYWTDHNKELKYIFVTFCWWNKVLSSLLFILLMVRFDIVILWFINSIYLVNQI